MKMNKESLATAIVSVIMFIILIINRLFNMDIALDTTTVTTFASFAAAGIVWFISFYRNHDTNAISNIFTKACRKVKELDKNGEVGRVIEITEELGKLVKDLENIDIEEVNQEITKTTSGVDYNEEA